MQGSRRASTSSIAHQGINPNEKSDRQPQFQHLGGNGEAATTGGIHEGITKRSMSRSSEMKGSEKETEDKSIWITFQERCSETISHEESTYPLAWQALLTGMVDALIYARSAIWTGFQTGK